MPLTVQCPICKTQVEWNDQSSFKPFCSERCKIIDFSDWASEKNTIPVKPESDINLSDDIGYDEPDFFKE